MKNKIKYAVLLAACLLFVSGCGHPVMQQPETAMRTVTDCIGRQAEVPETVSKIAAVDSFAGELMVMTGAGDQMVCCPGGVQSNLLLQELYPELSEKEVVQSGGTINAEALLQLDPDVILLKNSFYLAPQELRKIEKLGIPWLVIRYTDMEEQIQAIRLIGEVAGGEARQKAEEIAAFYEEVIDLAEEKTAGIPEEERKSVYHSINGVMRTDGEDSLGADWIQAAGCRDVSVGEPLLVEGDVYTAGSEQLFLWDPDAVICNDALTADYFRNGDAFGGLRAVRNQEVYNIPVGASRWGQQGSTETFFALLWLGKTMYPEYYEEIDLKKEVFDFYEEVLGLALDDATYQMMLDGVGIRQASRSAGK